MSIPTNLSVNQKGLAPILIIIILAASLVGGYLVYINYSNNQNKTIPPLIPQSTPQPLPTPTDETTKWKTYTNIDRSYSFKYPSNIWISSEEFIKPGGKAEEQEQVIVDNVPLVDGVASISVIERGKTLQQNLIEFTNAYIKEYSEFKMSTFKNITVDNRPAIYAEALLNNRETAYFIFIERDNSHLVILDLMGNNETKDQQLKSTFDQILSTFRFD